MTEAEAKPSFLRVLRFAKSGVRRILRWLGYDLVPAPDVAALAHLSKFQPGEETRYRWLNGLGVRTVLDVGAHEGESALQFRRLFPEAFIHSFEPLQDCFEKLREIMRGDSRHRAYPCALGERIFSSEMHRSAYSPSSSLLPMGKIHKEAYPFSAEAKTVPVSVSSLDAFSESADWRQEILLKIDTQGYERQVLQGGFRTLERVRAVILETSFARLYEGQSLFADIYALLTAKGFEYAGSWDQFLDPRDGRPLQQDAIFLRRG